MSDFVWPDDTNRLVIIGQTGTGKSQAAAWHLSRRSFTSKPWTIFDPKRDELLGKVGAEEIRLDKPPPKKPGLYIAHPLPGADDALVERYIWRATENRDHGMHFDEAYSIPRASKAFNRVLTQGRALRVPAIVCTQRPSWVDRFVWSEASMFQYFWVNSRVDQKAFAGNVKFDPGSRLVGEDGKPLKFWSQWYDVSRDEVAVLRPVPGAAIIRQMFRDRLKPGRKRKV